MEKTLDTHLFMIQSLKTLGIKGNFWKPIKKASLKTQQLTLFKGERKN